MTAAHRTEGAAGPLTDARAPTEQPTGVADHRFDHGTGHAKIRARGRVDGRRFDRGTAGGAGHAIQGGQKQTEPRAGSTGAGSTAARAGRALPCRARVRPSSAPTIRTRRPAGRGPERRRTARTPGPRRGRSRAGSGISRTADGPLPGRPRPLPGQLRPLRTATGHSQDGPDHSRADSDLSGPRRAALKWAVTAPGPGQAGWGACLSASRSGWGVGGASGCQVAFLGTGRLAGARDPRPGPVARR